VSDPVTFAPPRLEVANKVIAGEVLHADHFGNCITSIGLLEWQGDEISFKPAFGEAGVKAVGRLRASEAVVTVAGRDIVGVRRTYAEVDSGEVLALVGSEGHLEIAVREGSAADELGLCPAEVVTLRLR
jgi:S-adenosylmethionine hydrolase